MHDKNYINSLRSKIRYRKVQNNISGFVGSAAIIIAVFFTFNLPVEDLLFDQYYESVSIYEWEIIEELTEDEIYNFLIDYTSLEDYDTIEDENILEWIETINLGG
jgi:hypothetical protein